MISSHVPWLAAFPTLATIQDPAWLTAVSAARVHLVRARRRLFADHELNKNFLLVASGRIQIYRAARGREMMLYRLGPGDVCIFNAVSHFAENGFYPITAVAETDTELVGLPSDLFQHAFGESPGFRQYVLHSFAQRMTDVMKLLEGIVFERLDVRLAKVLLAHTCDDTENCVCITHQDIAKELGSSREVISRLLKGFERKGWVSLARGEIQLHAENDLRDFIQRHLPGKPF